MTSLVVTMTMWQLLINVSWCYKYGVFVYTMGRLLVHVLYYYKYSIFAGHYLIYSAIHIGSCFSSAYQEEIYSWY